jgi:septum site-determining protein MinD
MANPIVINIISGKGGTGKSLITAVLGRLIAQEGASVLLVDLDLFVRGLTNFFYLYKKEQRKITSFQTVADIFGFTNDVNSNSILKFERFYEVDFLPAVSEIEELLSYKNDDKLESFRAKELFKRLRKEDFDYIFVDNRAGVDGLILTSCEMADISISVTESDPVSRTTNDNLLRHIKSFSKVKVYTIFNKFRNIKTIEDYRMNASEIRSDFEVAGKIPFDVDLFENFGNPNFWDEINSTKFTFGLAESWNKISKREGLKHSIDQKRFPEHRIWRINSSTSFIANKFESFSLFFGVTFILTYLAFDKITNWHFQIKDILLLYGISMLTFPFVKRLLMDTIGKNES